MTGVEVRSVGERTGFEVCRAARRRGVIDPAARRRRRADAAARASPTTTWTNCSASSTSRSARSCGERPLDRVRAALCRARGRRAAPHAAAAPGRRRTCWSWPATTTSGSPGDPRVVAAAADAARIVGRRVDRFAARHRHDRTARANSSANSPRSAGAPAALVFSSGYLANLGVLTALGGPDVDDRLGRGQPRVAHRRLPALRLAGRGRPAPRPRQARRRPVRRRPPNRVVVTDAVFSVDGDLAPLAAMHDVTRAHGALLVIDEAHALGVVGPEGRGAAEAAGLAGEPDVVRTVTLSKSLGAQGGAVLGDPAVIDLLVSTARPVHLRHRAGAPVRRRGAGRARGCCATSRARPAAARANARRLAAIVRDLGVETVEPDAAVVPAFLGDPRRAVAAAAACLDAGVRVGCFRPPSVPPGRSCLRASPPRAPNLLAGRPRPCRQGATRPEAPTERRMSVLIVTGTAPTSARRWRQPPSRRCAHGSVAVVKPAQTGVAPGEPGDLAEVTRLSGVTDAVRVRPLPRPALAAPRRAGQRPAGARVRRRGPAHRRSGRPARPGPRRGRGRLARPVRLA